MFLLVAFVFFVLGPVFSQAQCGQRPGARIVGGSTATPNSWPWQLSLRVKNYHSCGASLINPRWAITAAHCVENENDPHMYTLVAGAHHIEKDGVVYRVNKIIMHAGYSNSHFRNDVALLRLAVPVKLDRKVGTICFPKSGSRVSPGTKCWITGWGTERFNIWGTSKYPKYLKQANVPIMDSRTCAKKAEADSNLEVHDPTMVCIGGKGSVGCYGDSGGPLVCEEGGRWVLRGIASWTGSKKCLTDNYTMYARVSNFINWINQQIANAGDGDYDGVCKDEMNSNVCYDMRSRKGCWDSSVYSKCQKTCGYCA